jgi:hypothetical protein
MRLIQAVIFGVGCLLVMGGYAASQFFWWTGRAFQWHRAIDRPEVALLATFVLVGALVVYALPDPSRPSESA